jgi:TRAP-type mannitol/chloroaromatic compound transport system permease small subunit
MMMAAIFMMGIAHALRQRDHVSVDLIYGMLPPRAQAAISIVGYVLLLPCVGWLTYALFHFALQAFRTGELTGQSAWNPVVWPYRAVLVLGFAVFTLQVVAELIKSARVLVADKGRSTDA